MKTLISNGKFWLMLLSSIFLFNACETETDQAKEEQQLMETDLQFSAQSAEKGMKAAFLEYVDQEGVMLRPGNLPIEGKAAIEAYLSEMPGHYFTITWKPIKAYVSEDADLGYTYGIWELVSNDSIQKTTRGTYATIWKKNEEGKWKLVLDTGTEGI